MLKTLSEGFLSALMKSHHTRRPFPVNGALYACAVRVFTFRARNEFSSTLSPIVVVNCFQFVLLLCQQCKQWWAKALFGEKYNSLFQDRSRCTVGAERWSTLNKLDTLVWSISALFWSDILPEIFYADQTNRVN